ncbi:MAG TPA: IPExxxVDY family protein [Bacteroidia bacterium]|nr:IPExxxVDY family protein [Bacteroidia bacterium]
MAKTVLKLNEEDQFDFLLFGIICQQKDYRLCREINLKLDLQLKREEDYKVFNGKRMEDQEFSFFRYINPEEDEYYLVSNRSVKGLLIPEQKQMDYFIIVRNGMSRIEDQTILSAIKQIRIVLGIYKLDAKNLKSKENLVF